VVGDAEPRRRARAHAHAPIITFPRDREREEAGAITVYTSIMKTALIILLASAATAFATPDAKRPAPPADAAKPVPPPDAAKAQCKVRGKVIFEIDRVVGDKVQSQTKVYETGAWTIEGFSDDGKPASSGHGCFDKAPLAKIKADVKSSPWKVTHNMIHCMAVSANSTVYFANGKKVFTARLCNSDALDDKSAKNVEELETLLKAPSSSASGDVK
jgi:hypothetical protein